MCAINYFCISNRLADEVGKKRHHGVKCVSRDKLPNFDFADNIALLSVRWNRMIALTSEKGAKIGLKVNAEKNQDYKTRKLENRRKDVHRWENSRTLPV